MPAHTLDRQLGEPSIRDKEAGNVGSNNDYLRSNNMQGTCQRPTHQQDPQLWQHKLEEGHDGGMQVTCRRQKGLPCCPAAASSKPPDPEAAARVQP